MSFPTKNFKCQICKKIYKTEKFLWIHIKVLHKSNTDQPCAICKKVFTTTWALKKHNWSVHQSIFKIRTYVNNVRLKIITSKVLYYSRCKPGFRVPEVLWRTGLQGRRTRHFFIFCQILDIFEDFSKWYEVKLL